MDRNTYYKRQKVTSVELNGTFDDVESMERNTHLDAQNVGVGAGLGVSEAISPNLTVLVQGPGVARDKLGRRAAIASTQVVDCSVDFLGQPTVPTVDPRIVSVFIQFARVDTDDRTDGDGNLVFFDNDEAFEFVVVRGAEGASPVPPGLDAQDILLADITLVPAQTQILNADIDDTRREWVYDAVQSPVSVRVGTAVEAVDQIVTQLGGHLAGTGDNHAAAAVTYAGGPDWNADSGPDTNPATTVEGQLDKTISDLATDANPSGAERVGSRGQTVGSESVTNGSVFSQITELLTSLGGKTQALPGARAMVTYGRQTGGGTDGTFTVEGAYTAGSSDDVFTVPIEVNSGIRILSVRARVGASPASTVTLDVRRVTDGSGASLGTDTSAAGPVTETLEVTGLTEDTPAVGVSIGQVYTAQFTFTGIGTVYSVEVETGPIP